MTTEIRQKPWAYIGTVHSAIEVAYPAAPVYLETSDFIEKRRLLLEDLSLHLAQDALQDDFPNPEKVRQHLFDTPKLYAELFPEEGFDTVHQALSISTHENI